MIVLPRRLFVIAAHPDDDTIGCGGMMARVADAGGALRIAYLSDGSRSHPGSRRFSPARIAKLREDEARAALAILGIRDEPLFFRLPDGMLDSIDAQERSEAVARLTREIAAFEPEVVLAPWRRDPHPDHMASAAIVSDALAGLERPPRLVSYEVWLPIRGSELDRPCEDEAITHAIAIDAEIRARKRRALLAHVTQTTNLIDDDPNGFRIDDALLARWIGPAEILHESRVGRADAG
jgi:LmbE family N-acetylglucosaminyl deacetylase